ncbi:hypothetical protein SBF1_3780001 [Candidatus Desulfosporosinus infrequens]|uniref:Uncharacterized protein n=1 Tax=Candidatus Desulfosporosinus infrequens TaxID=2043169 RepID=A0A2U3L595_9FIRM|nr:hypothetical protein SBF1_3780001 [Candidatus Desulfosporosinus infrequens]
MPNPNCYSFEIGKNTSEINGLTVVEAKALTLRRTNALEYFLGHHVSKI